MKPKKGVVIELNGKFLHEWEDRSGPGSSSGWAWGPVEEAKIYDPRYVTRPTDAAHHSFPIHEDLRRARLMKARRKIIVSVEPI